MYKMKNITKKKRKKLRKLSGEGDIKELVSERFTEHLSLFNFFDDFLKYYNHPSLEKPSNAATLLDGRYEGKFVSPNVINLSKRHLSKDEISLLSKGLKFIPTPKHISKARIKEELETYGRKLRLMWYYRHQEREIIINPFKKKSKFNPKRKGAAIEIYLSRLEEEILVLDKKLSYSNVTKEERHTLYSLRDDTSIVIKEADKGSGIVVWDTEGYLAEARTQLKDKAVYQELKGNTEGPLENIIKSVLRKVRDRKDMSDETLDYFWLTTQSLGDFIYFLRYTKGIHKIHNI